MLVSLRSKLKVCTRDIPTGNYCRIIPHSNMQGSSAVLTPPTKSWYFLVSTDGLNASLCTWAHWGEVPPLLAAVVVETWRNLWRQQTMSGRRHLRDGPSRKVWSVQPWHAGLGGTSLRDWIVPRVSWKEIFTYFKLSALNRSLNFLSYTMIYNTAYNLIRNQDFEFYGVLF